MEELNCKIEIIEYYIKKTHCKEMYKQHRLISLDFPLINKQQYDQRARIASRTIEIVKQSLDKQDKKCLRMLSRAKQDGRMFKEVENGLKDYNKLQFYAGSVGLNLLSRSNTPKNVAVVEKDKPRSYSAYLTTYQSYNRKLQICRSTSQERKENVQNIRKKTSVHSIIAPMLTNPNKLKLKIQNSKH